MVTDRPLMEIRRFAPRSPGLRPLIKYFWISDSGGNVDMDHKILPMANIDLLFNLAAPIFYEKCGRLRATPGGMFLTGLTSRHMVMKQQGRIRLIGVSFFPSGLYPFIRIPVSELRDATVGLEQILGSDAARLEEQLHSTECLQSRLRLLEERLLELLIRNVRSTEVSSELALSFISSGISSGQSIRDFCDASGAHPRTLERHLNRHVGASPRQYLRLRRYQDALTRLMAGQPQSLTELAHELGYYDQAHFINDFKSFTGSAPSVFLEERRSFIQIMKIS